MLPTLRHCLLAGLFLSLPAGFAYAAEPIVVIESDMSPAEKDLLRSVLGEVDAPARSLAQARRRVEAAAKSARSVMRSLGYYEVEIRAEVIETRAEARAVDNDSAVSVRRPPQAVLYVTTGEQFTYGNVDVVFKDGPPVDLSVITDAVDIKSGQAAKAAPVVATELRLANKGFPKMIAPFESGEMYSAKKINRLAARVIGTGVFDSATATLADDGIENADGTITKNVILNVEQGAINTVSGEIGFSTSDGSGVDVTYERRNFVGFAQTLTLDARLKTNEIGVGAAYNIPYAWREDRELDLAMDVARLDTDAFVGERVLANTLVTQKFSRKFKLGLGLGVEASRFDQEGVETTAYLVEGLGRAVLDTRDNLLNPVKGFNVEAAVVPTYNFGDEDGTFTTLTLDASSYKRVSEKFVLAGRVGTGTIVSEDFETVPQNRRFYAGGGGSVRGYEFQSISPRVVTTSVDENGETVTETDLIGGRTLLEGSAEVRYKGDGPIGYVGFVDAGTVSRAQASGLDDIRVGAGVGVRYYTSFAPLRADIAIPLNPQSGDADFQVYISIGQAF